MNGAIVNIWGVPWTFKSHLAISSVEHVKGGVAIVDLDRRLDAVLPHFKEQAKRITVDRPALPQTLGLDDIDAVVKPGGWLKVFRSCGQLLKKAADSPSVEVVVIDTSTIFYQIVREARLEQIAQEASGKGEKRTALNKFEYGPISSYMLAAYSYVKDRGKILVLVSHSRPIYDAEGKETGEFEADSWGGQTGACDIEVEAVRIGDDVKLLVKKNGFARSATSSALSCSWQTITELSQGKHVAKVSK